uniref:Uncharacterized protein n=1 Tax=Anguilla anguilla TaxID=7936 RepID=A0A0E9TBE3_ANGAN
MAPRADVCLFSLSLMHAHTHAHTHLSYITQLPTDISDDTIGCTNIQPQINQHHRLGPLNAYI